MWSGTYSVGSATSCSGNSGKSRSTSPIHRQGRPVSRRGRAPRSSGCGAICTTWGVVAEVPPTVLVVSETAGFHHDSIPAQQAFLRSLRGLRVVVLPRVAQLTAARLRGARAVVFASTSGEPRFSATARRALLRFVRDGGGFVGTHSASDTFARWPGYVRLLGTRFPRHGPIEARRVVVADRRHSITRGLGASFVHTDEYYRFVSPPRAHVLLRDGAGG